MSTTLASFHFLGPWWLLLLILAIFLCWHLRHQADATALWATAIAPNILRALTIGGDGQSRVAPSNLLLLEWLISIVAAAVPTWKREPSPFVDARPPAMVVIKVTPSMKAEGLRPIRIAHNHHPPDGRTLASSLKQIRHELLERADIHHKPSALPPFNPVSSP